VPANGLLPNPGYAVNSRARPDPLRLPSLDAWNLSLQQSLTSTLSLTVAYVGNKGTHTLADNSQNSTNPNETAISLPAQYSITGQPLHYEPASSVAPGTNYGARSLNGQPVPGISSSGGTSITNYLQRYYGGKLPACADPAYRIPANPLLGGGQCGWTNAMTFYSNNFDTHYNALQVSVAKQFSRGLSLNANYAWQHATSWSNGYSTWSKPAVKGRDSFLRQQQVIIYGLYELPFGRNKPLFSQVSPVVNQIIGGWQLSPVLNYSSGLPFTLGYSTCGNQIPSGAPCRVNGNPGAFHPHITGSPGHNLQYFSATDYPLNGSAFSIPGLNQIGNVGRNSVFGPHLFNTDLAVQKNFPIREVATVQFRTDFFNVFNHINYGMPGGAPTTANLDQNATISTGAYPDGATRPRQLQFSLRVQF
jgi:hypothetical protein